MRTTRAPERRGKSGSFFWGVRVVRLVALCFVGGCLVRLGVVNCFVVCVWCIGFGVVGSEALLAHQPDHNQIYHNQITPTSPSALGTAAPRSKGLDHPAAAPPAPGWWWRPWLRWRPPKRPAPRPAHQAARSVHSVGASECWFRVLCVWWGVRGCCFDGGVVRGTAIWLQKRSRARSGSQLRTEAACPAPNPIYPTLCYKTTHTRAHLRLIHGSQQHEQLVCGGVCQQQQVVGGVLVVRGHQQRHHLLQERLAGPGGWRFTGVLFCWLRVDGCTGMDGWMDANMLLSGAPIRYCSPKPLPCQSAAQQHIQVRPISGAGAHLWKLKRVSRST